MTLIVKTLPFDQAVNRLELPDFNKNLFASSDWLAVLQKTYGLRIFLKYIERDGKPDAYIIYSVVKNFLEWKICVCSYCDYFDCRVNSRDDWRLFFQSLRDEYPQYRIAVRNLRDDVVRQSPDFKFLSKEWFHIVDVRDDLESVWKRTHDSFKSAVKQSQKMGVLVKPCGKGYLREFYRLHLQLRKNKYRLFPQPYRFFDNIWEQYMTKDNGVLLGAFDPQGQFIGGNVYLICDKTLYYKFNTSSLGALRFRPNNHMFWEGLRLAKERGLDYVDLGSSGLHQEGLVLFKNHAGANSMEIHHLGFAPPDYKYSRKIILSLLTRSFTQGWVPDCCTEWGSSLIYPYLA
ncbi:MAG: GNAT family N-acetyltransferase [Candidatus Omnitrophota bacterium]|nr:GNAT family N-acetyltransferase [Candidatus Omnitrophota bacterium]MDZ4243466.1 GNAT family N-acetyltransferase [Candidatus Omnitrophota bacterium]